MSHYGHFVHGFHEERGETPAFRGDSPKRGYSRVDEPLMTTPKNPILRGAVLANHMFPAAETVAGGMYWSGRGKA